MSRQHHPQESPQPQQEQVREKPGGRPDHDARKRHQGVGKEFGYAEIELVGW